jgi:DNA mismatch endonuclease (patch repair protein)
MSKFAFSVTRKFSKLARLETRRGSEGDEILWGSLENGTEVMVTPERDRAARPGEFVLMVRGDLVPVLRGNDRRLPPLPPTEPYRPSAWRRSFLDERGPVETGVEAYVRRALLGIGVRCHEKVADLPGTPDFYLPDVHAVVLAHGCFWHGHACASVYPPHVATERAEKIRRASKRDPVVIDRLQRLNLRVLVIWECAVTGDGALTEAALREECEDFITGSEAFREIVGRNAPEII